MVRFLILSLLLFLITSFSLFGQETRVIKGIVTYEVNEVLIGATVQEFGNSQNYSLTNVAGEFELTIPQKDKVVLRFTYGCSAFYEVLYEVDKEEDYLKIDTYTKSTDRNTKKIRRKLKL